MSVDVVGWLNNHGHAYRCAVGKSASWWHRAWLAGGRDALVGARRLGRTARLSDEQLAGVEAALRDGPKVNGFGTDMWTLARVAEVVERMTGVRYTLSQTWLILRQRLGWTRQRPARRAVERDDAAIEAWVKREPGRPRGQTPVLRHRFSWTRMSMAGVLAYRTDRSRARLVFQTRPGSYNTESLIEFLTELRRHLRGKPVVLIWDGLSAHRSRDMKAWRATQRHWLVVEQLPGYAHDINPLELVWGNLKATELANLCPEHIDEADTHR